MVPSNMPPEDITDIRDLALEYISSLQKIRKEQELVRQEFDLWEYRRNLAHKSGLNDLQEIAANRTDNLQAQLHELKTQQQHLRTNLAQIRHRTSETDHETQIAIDKELQHRV